MVKKQKNKQTSKAVQEEALKIPKGRQRPGQTKEQTRLIAQGIQGGIAEYKKQQSAKARELDRKLKKLGQQTDQQQKYFEIEPNHQGAEVPWYKRPLFLLCLLTITWGGIALYIFV